MGLTADLTWLKNEFEKGKAGRKKQSSKKYGDTKG